MKRLQVDFAENWQVWTSPWWAGKRARRFSRDFPPLVGGGDEGGGRRKDGKGRKEGRWVKEG